MPSNAVKKFQGQAWHKVRLGGLERDLPLVKVATDLWIASNAEFILGDVDLITAAAELLSKEVGNRRPNVILTAEAKSIALAFELSKRLGHDRFIVARKTLKSYMGDHSAQRVRSITTETEQELLVTKEEMQYLSGKRVCLLDDVVSTGGTFRALENLVSGSGGRVVCKAAVWREGPWYEDTDLVFVGQLPVYVGPNSPLASQIEA